MTAAQHADLLDHVDTLLALPADWDSYGARRVTVAARDAVRDLLQALPADCPPPFVVPLASGGLQCEFADPGETECCVGPDGRRWEWAAQSGDEYAGGEGLPLATLLALLPVLQRG